MTTVQTPFGLARVTIHHYRNGRPAIVLDDAETGEPICVASINIPEFPVADGFVLLKGWSENEGFPELLEAAGIVGPCQGRTPAGWESATLHRLLLDPKED